MKNKYSLVILNIFITIVSIYFTYAVYKEYKKHQSIKVNNYIEKSIERNKSIIRNTFKNISNEIEKDRRLFKEIHEVYTKRLRQNPNLNLSNLKEDIISSYELNGNEIHLFLLNNKYTIIKSTYKPDIGFDLSLVPDAREELDESHNMQIHQSPSVSIDILNSEVKSYSYSKINNQLFFEMGFINKKVKNSLKNAMAKIKLLTNEKSNLFRIEKKLNGSEYYDNILEKKVIQTKEEYLSSKKKFFENQKSDDLIIKANRDGKSYLKELDDYLIYYTPIIKKNNEYLHLVGDFVLELYIDRKYQKELDKKIDSYFYIFLLFHIFFLIIIYYFTIKYYDAQQALNKKVLENQELLNENRSFINSMTKQISSPLSVIMNNFAFIEKYIGKENNRYKEQVNSSINMLKNSYDDLNFIVENEKLVYPKTKINLSEFLHKRLDFFNSIIKSYNKTISISIQDDIFIDFNAAELERLIDNNLSNAIKYGNINSSISVSLVKKPDGIYLKFYSYSHEIKDKEKIFIKNYQEKFSHKRSLGLGLSMVRSICEKNNITYHVEYDNFQNIFVYKFDF